MEVLHYGTQALFSANVLNYALSLLVMELMQELMDAKSASNEGVKANRLMYEIMEYVRLNSGIGLTVQEVARQFCYNPDYLSTTFRRVTGEPLLSYIHKMQIASAKRLLLESSLQVRQIAFSVGFRDEKHFMKIFKEYEKLTPSQYRNAFAKVSLSNK
ncbi:MAG: helix-turn-helix transcriptional regulator [Clostridiales bacterium]|jgi:YesN/AraC family two-component response regulator|nr:helix-turn-helix transcriptional regulator [Clostridiales bacterium]